MADNMSSEGKVSTLECMQCGFREVFTEQQFKLVDGLSCCKCNGPVKHSFTKPNEELNNRRLKHRSGNEIVTYAMYHCLRCKHKERVRGKRKDYQEVTVCPKCNGAFVDRWKLDKYTGGIDISNGPDLSVIGIDFTDAIKGLKAVQREARKSVAALREVEEYKRDRSDSYD